MPKLPCVSGARIIKAPRRLGFEVQTEECRLFPANQLGEHFYNVEKGRLIRSSAAVAPAVFPDRLFLVAHDERDPS